MRCIRYHCTGNVWVGSTLGAFPTAMPIPACACGACSPAWFRQGWTCPAVMPPPRVVHWPVPSLALDAYQHTRTFADYKGIDTSFMQWTPKWSSFPSCERPVVAHLRENGLDYKEVRTAFTWRDRAAG